MNSTALFKRLGLSSHPRFVARPGKGAAGVQVVHSPIDGSVLGGVRLDDAKKYEAAIRSAQEAFEKWRLVPAPVRGQIVRELGDAIRAHKADLGMLVSLEVGKITSEGQGEIQEIVDIADFAVGLSRQLPGQVFPSERAHHRIVEQWLPLGLVGVISAFNFPAAVWAWNACLAAVCGDVTIWKPSLLAPLTALACNSIAEKVAAKHGHPGIFQLIIGSDEQIGKPLVADKRVALISATGSTRMGRAVGQVVAQRLGRTLLELGGNNAVIVTEEADLKLAIPAIVFGAVGTAGQRCTTTRRLIVHEKLADRVCKKLVAAFEQVMSRIGDPTAPGTLVGPLINEQAVKNYEHAVLAAKAEGGRVLIGGQRVKKASLKSQNGGSGLYVQPTIVRAPASNKLPIAQEETFAPILYVFTFKTLSQAIAIQNSVDAGLSSAIFTERFREVEAFLHPGGTGSDCGIANINCGTSGAEIGGAFGGEKDTGGGRESGSDSWKAYMRRQTSAINFSGTLALAQGIKFE
ncbi:MAG: aldehyde dehydrogenase family protein [Phycisphaerales bacterium]|jgi:aldehyde dehydrogenase (NAD+)|nr:aldehyde dehydrogenase family protein [Phycisphaerales bacterium]